MDRCRAHRRRRVAGSPLQHPSRRKNRMKETSMNRLTWVEYQGRVREERAPVYLPVGALEQHGPHLPLGTDAMLAAAVTEGAAGETAGLAAPALAYGYKSQPKCGGGQHFPGTTSLDAPTPAHTLRTAMRELGGRTPLTIMRMEYWDFLTPETLARVFPDGFPGYALEHAAVIETSMMLHYHPELVRLDRIPSDPPADFPPYDIYPTRTGWVPPSGVLSSAKAATMEKGKAMAAEVSGLIAKAVRKEYA